MCMKRTIPTSAHRSAGRKRSAGLLDSQAGPAVAEQACSREQVIDEKARERQRAGTEGSASGWAFACGNGGEGFRSVRLVRGFPSAGSQEQACGPSAVCSTSPAEEKGVTAISDSEDPVSTAWPARGGAYDKGFALERKHLAHRHRPCSQTSL